MISASEKELKLIHKAAREFAQKALLPDREQTDRYPFEEFSLSTLEDAMAVDFFHMNLAEEFGGLGRKLTPLSIVLQHICEVDASMGGIIFANAFSQDMLFESGTTHLLKEITSAESVREYLIAYPVFSRPDETEPTVTGEKNNGKYSLSGSLEQLVLGNIAKHALIPANLSGQTRPSLFCIDLESQGVHIGDPVLNLGLRSCPCVDLRLDGADAVLAGEEEKAGIYFSDVSERLQLLGAAMSAGVMEGSYKEALGYTRNRDQGGRKIYNWSEVQMMLSDMAVKKHTSKMLLACACSAADADSPNWEKDAGATAIYILDNACRVTTDGVQLLGGSGYMKDFGQEKRYRDAKQLQALLGISPLKKIRYLQMQA